MLQHILQSPPATSAHPSPEEKEMVHPFCCRCGAPAPAQCCTGMAFQQEWAIRFANRCNKSSPTVPADIEPARDKAILTLANGEQIILDDAANGNITNQSGVSVIKLNGQLSYNTPSSGNSNEIVYNTISTAKGKQYRLILEDGSSVWLNAASSLRFPVSFPGNERRVQLNGEGYFEISKDSRRPFHVIAAYNQW